MASAPQDGNFLDNFMPTISQGYHIVWIISYFEIHLEGIPYLPERVELTKLIWPF